MPCKKVPKDNLYSFSRIKNALHFHFIWKCSLQSHKFCPKLCNPFCCQIHLGKIWNFEIQRLKLGHSLLLSLVLKKSYFKVGLSSFLELFRRAPETLSVFPFLKQLGPEDMEFYHQLKNHSIRITGVISMLVKQVTFFKGQQTLPI